MGTRGEIYADMKANVIRVMRFGQEDEVIDVRTLADDFSGHGGGDARMISELVALLQGRAPKTNTLTSIDRSVGSHLVALAAEASRRADGRMIALR